LAQAKNKSESSLRYWHVVEELRRMLRDAFAFSFKGLVLYGSHARGEPDEESDIDLLVLFKDRAAAMRADARVNDLACRLSSEHNELVSTVTMGEREYQEGRSPFFLTVKREGILIVPDEVFDMSPEIARLLEMGRESLDVANDIFEREHYGFVASRAYKQHFRRLVLSQHSFDMR
jgi:predicted nucleotidyltransferase